MQFDIETKGGFTLPAAGQTSVAFLCYYDNENTKRFCTSILNLQEGWAYRRFPQPFRPEALVQSASVFFLSGIKVFSFLRSSSFSLRYSLSCDGHHTRVPRPSYERMVAAVQTVPQSPYNHSVPIFVYPFRCS